MTKTLYWIDDDQKTKNRQAPEGAPKEELEQALGVSIEVKPFPSSSEFEAFVNTIDAQKTYGVLMDYQLVKVGAGKSTEYGTTWAAHLRADKPSIPVIGLSSERESSIPRFRIENFLAFFPRGDLIGDTPPTGQLRSLFEGYRRLWQQYQQKKSEVGLDVIMPLIKAPDTILDHVRTALPSALRMKWDDESPHAAARWIWHEFQGRTGFLFDELETATYLGLTEGAFRQHQDHFNAARYNGALACNDRPRWWLAQLRGVVEGLVGTNIVGPTSHARDRLLAALKVPVKAREAMKSQPHARKPDSIIPECVAFRDGESKNAGKLGARVATLLRDTIVDEQDANPPFGFQALRYFQLNADS